MSKKRKTKSSLFNPDKIATAISQNLNRDLSSVNQMYGGCNMLQQFYQEAQKEACLKKYASLDAGIDELEDSAFSSFLEVNEHMKRVNESFREPRDISPIHQSDHERMLVRARALMHWVLGPFQWGEFCENVSHSGGVTRGVSYSDTSMEAKFTWPMSSTVEAAAIFRQYLSESNLLQDAIVNHNRHQPLAERYTFVDGSRATTVPKSVDKRRMIAIEPTVNMFLQQGLMQLLYKRMKTVGLDVESLPFEHVELARQGSISGNLATIDFSSASDCVSIELLRWLLPPKWFDIVNRLRCPFMEIKGEKHLLHMVSTMGNAGTFPLETLVFWTLGVAAVMHHTRSNPFSLLSLPEERAMVSVFGDDCILPTDYSATFISITESVGFFVNKEKSFYHRRPRFRESCGGDFLRGSNVRPLYIKAPTGKRMSALEPWLYIILNGVLKKYVEYFGHLKYVYEKELLAYLFSLFKKYKLKVKLVPSYFPDDAGLKTSDWRRLRDCYGVEFDKVVVSDQGTYSFRYCRYVYRHSENRDDYVRYACWLGKPSRSTEAKIRTQFPIRKKGGYVVAKGLSSCWSL